MRTRRGFQNWNDLRLDWLSSDFDVFIGNVNVNFRSNAKFSFEINPGLDGKTNSGNDSPRIARLEVIDVDAITVSLFADRMPRSMRELFAKTCARDYAARHIVHFGAANRFTSADILAHEINRRITRLPDNVKNARK